MKTFTISAAVALLAAFAQAAPAQIELGARTQYETLKFEGATPTAAYSLTEPCNGSTFPICMSLASFHVFLVVIILIDHPFPILLMPAKLRGVNLAKLYRSQHPERVTYPGQWRLHMHDLWH